jgi:hypothetical protein
MGWDVEGKAVIVRVEYVDIGLYKDVQRPISSLAHLATVTQVRFRSTRDGGNGLSSRLEVNANGLAKEYLE